ncbi:MAG TPA: DUF2911 domain-containing protein [Candidatus Angelobacter sp.]|nr:DUF2911 domain-containing protein [Candidatus Angelobacter sp.]
MRWFAALVLLGSLQCNLMGQAPSQAPTKNATCTFQDGKEISLRYTSVPADKVELQDGKPYMPGGSPLLLFSQTSMLAGTSEIPAGAFSVYVIPASKDKWNLAINKNISSATKYDATQDLVRLPLELGKVPTKTESLKIIFVHIAPKQCNIRIYEGRELASGGGFEEK